MSALQPSSSPSSLGQPDAFHVTRWWSHQPHVVGFWGPTTASIDWCESNYAVSRFIAEFANTLSNLIFVGLAIYGLKKCRQERLPLPLALCQLGIALVGIGSFAFHATLKYEWQLGDELPMIYCSCLIAYVAFDVDQRDSISTHHDSPSSPSSTSDTKTSCRRRTKDWWKTLLPFVLSSYALLVTLVYLRYPNPVFHQTAYAFIQLVATVRVGWVLMNQPRVTIQEVRNQKDATRCEILGTALFLTGFLIWNIDNLFCDQISHLKVLLGSPLSFLVEGHAWWHLLTGVGAYLIVVGIQLLSVTMKQGADGFELKTGTLWLPYVARIPIHHSGPRGRRESSDSSTGPDGVVDNKTSPAENNNARLIGLKGN